MTRPAILPLSAALMLVLTGCSTQRESQPGRTATEQLLFSTAADRAADKLALNLPQGTKVFVDATFTEGTDSKYLISSIRDRVMRKGADLTDDKGQAEIIIEPRIGAISVDGDKFLFGLPAIPVPLIGMEVPEIALFKRNHEQGVIKVAATAYNAKTGLLIQSLDPVYSFSSNKEWTALLFLSWSTNDLMPEPDRQQWIGR